MRRRVAGRRGSAGARTGGMLSRKSSATASVPFDAGPDFREGRAARFERCIRGPYTALSGASHANRIGDLHDGAYESIEELLLRGRRQHIVASPSLVLSRLWSVSSGRRTASADELAAAPIGALPRPSIRTLAHELWLSLGMQTQQNGVAVRRSTIRKRMSKCCRGKTVTLVSRGCAAVRCP